MVFYAVFAPETARAPAGLSNSPRAAHPWGKPNHNEEQEAATCAAALDRAFSDMKAGPNTRAQHALGHGSGFAFEHSPYCSYASNNHLHVMLAGEVAEWPGLDAISVAHNAFVRNEAPAEVDDAHWLFDFYNTFCAPDADGVEPTNVMDRALECLAKVRGSFAFVVYDSLHRRVMAGRDVEGSQPMWWGATEDGHLMIGSSLAHLQECNPNACMFPAGTLFASEPRTIAFCPGAQGWVVSDDANPGTLRSFVRSPDNLHWRGVKAIPRITSKGFICGSVYKVASRADLETFTMDAGVF